VTKEERKYHQEQAKEIRSLLNTLQLETQMCNTATKGIGNGGSSAFTSGVKRIMAITQRLEDYALSLTGDGQMHLDIVQQSPKGE
jgi:hypothetical protein